MNRSADKSVVLVVDDEDLCLALIAEHLTDCGYQVCRAHTGMEALRLLERDRGRIALAVVDFRMPGMYGPELLRAIEERHPGLPAVLMSAYGAWVWDEDTYPWRVGALSKPFCLEKLETLIEGELGR